MIANLRILCRFILLNKNRALFVEQNKFVNGTLFVEPRNGGSNKKDAFEKGKNLEASIATRHNTPEDIKLVFLSY